MTRVSNYKWDSCSSHRHLVGREAGRAEASAGMGRAKHRISHQGRCGDSEAGLLGPGQDDRPAAGVGPRALGLGANPSLRVLMNLSSDLMS